MTETRYKESQSSIAAWREKTFGPTNRGGITKATRLAIRANVEMAELLDVASQGSFGAFPNKDKIIQECADVLIVLYGLADLCELDLHKAVDEKMEINRKRKWYRLGDGTGYHVHEKEDRNEKEPEVESKLGHIHIDEVGREVE